MLLLIALTLAPALCQAEMPADSDEARLQLRPSLVEVCERANAYIREDDWKRATISLEVASPLAKSLDAKWRTKLDEGVQKALAAKDAQATLKATLSIVYWDMRDLLAPMTTKVELKPADLKSRLLKARMDLRHLAPLIKALRIGPKEIRRDSGRRLYARFEKTLVNSIGSLPSGRPYGQDPAWRTDLSTDIKNLLDTIQVALSDLHPPPPKKPEEDEPEKADKEKPEQDETEQGGVK